MKEKRKEETYLVFVDGLIDFRVARHCHRPDKLPIFFPSLPLADVDGVLRDPFGGEGVVGRGILLPFHLSFSLGGGFPFLRFLAKAFECFLGRRRRCLTVIGRGRVVFYRGMVVGRDEGRREGGEGNRGREKRRRGRAKRRTHVNNITIVSESIKTPRFMSKLVKTLRTQCSPLAYPWRRKELGRSAGRTWQLKVAAGGQKRGQLWPLPRPGRRGISFCS